VAAPAPAAATPMPTATAAVASTAATVRMIIRRSDLGGVMPFPSRAYRTQP
jgi:hypothetical protein